jgi:arabinofuranosyltransferase
MKKKEVPQPQTQMFEPTKFVGICMVLLFFLVIVFRTAWISDDACISFRTVDQFLNGNGLRWNASERVQTYTNPLMVFCMILLSFFTGEYYLTAMLFNIATAFAAVLIFIFGIAKAKWSRFAFPMTILLLSKAFIDFATSGLENSLEYLIIACFYYFYLKWDRFSKKQLLLLSFIGCLSLLNRMDSILLLLPALFDAFVLRGEEKWWKNILPGMIGIIPFLLWELFSLFYYGFLFPNTAYAKLNAGIPKSEYYLNGILYYLDSLSNDPITLFSIAVSLIVSGYLFVKSKDRKIFCAGIGIFLYLIYLIRIGGDFITGRFFAIILFMACITISRMEFNRKLLVISVCLMFFVTNTMPNNNITSGRDYAIGDHFNGIGDYRGVRYPSTGLLRLGRYNDKFVTNTHQFAKDAESDIIEGKKVVVKTGIGYYGLTAGDKIHVVDRVALGDPLLARLPSKYNPTWRVAHLYRQIPEGYLETVESGINQIADPQLAEYYDVLHNIISGDLFSWERMEQIVKMNLGMYDHLIDVERYRQKAGEIMSEEEMQRIINPGEAWDNPNAWILDESGTSIHLDQLAHAKTVSFLADNNDSYKIVLSKNEQILYEQSTEPIDGDGMQPREVKVPDDISSQGFDTITVIPFGGDQKYSIGYLQY